MKRNVEERVVEMRFENSQFESGVNTTLSTLDKLEQKLQFKGSEAGMANLEAKAKSFDMSSMGNAAESVTNKFSALEVAGLAAIASLVNAATDAAIKIGKNLFNKYIIKPISDGFGEYELLQNTIQTIYTNTKSKGTTIDEIESGLDELNKYADDTIYVMSDMTRAIGQFTNAGIGFADSKKAVVGFANLAAAVGATNEQLSRVEYQSSQAMSAGVFRLMDWNSIQNSPLGGEFFQKALIRNAKDYYANLSDAQKEALYFTDEDISAVLNGLQQMEDGVISFRQSFHEKESFYSGWLKSDIFTETLKQFADDPELYEAATSVRTFTKMRETLEEAAGSGWAQTWKLIVGDFGESKALWTDVSGTLSRILDGISDARNKIIAFWKEAGGRDDIIQGLKNSMEALIRILTPIKEAFDEVLSPALEDYLLRVSKRFEEFTGKLLIGEETATGIKTVFKIIFTVAKIALIIFEKISNVISTVVYLIGKAVGDIFQLVGGITGLKEKIIGVWEDIQNFLDKHGIKFSFKGLSLFGENLDEISDKEEKLKDKLTLKESKLDPTSVLENGFGKMFAEDKIISLKENLSKVITWIGNAGNKIFEFFKNQDFITKENIFDFFSRIVEIGKSLPAAIKNGWGKLVTIWENFKTTPEFESLSGALKALGDSLWNFVKLVGQGALDLFNKVVDSLKDPEKRAERAQKVSDAFNAIAAALKAIAAIVTPAAEGLKNFFDNIIGHFSNTETDEIEETSEAVDKLDKSVENLNENNKKTTRSSGGILAGLIGPNPEKEKKEGEKYTDFYNEFVEAHSGKNAEKQSIFEKIFSEDQIYLKKMLKTGGVIGAIGLLVAGYIGIVRLINSIRKVNTKFIKNVLGPIKKVLTKGVDLFGLKAFAKAIKAREKAKRFRDIAVGIALIAGSIALIAYAAKDPDTLWTAVAIVGGIAAVMTAITILLGKLKLTGLDSVSKTFISIGIAVALIAASMAALGYLVSTSENPDKIFKAINKIFGVIIALGVLVYAVESGSAFYGKINDGTWKTILSVSAAVFIIASAIKKLAVVADLNPGALIGAMIAIVAVMAMLAAIIIAVRKMSTFDGALFLSLGSMMKSLAIAIALMVVAIKIIGSMDPGSVALGSGLVYGMLAIFGLFFNIIGHMKIDGKQLKNIEKLGLAAILISVAVDLLIPAVAALTLLISLDTGSAIAAIVSIGFLFAGMSIALGFASKLSIGTGNSVLKIAGSMIIFALAATIISKAISKMQNSIIEDASSFGKALIAIGTIFLVFSALSAIFTAFPAVEGGVVILTSLTLAFVIFAAGVFILSKAALNFAKAVSKFAEGLMLLSSVTKDGLDRIKSNLIRFIENSYEIWVALGGAFVAGAHVFYDAFFEISPLLEGVITEIFAIIERVTNSKVKSGGDNLGVSLGQMLLNALGRLIAFIGEHSMEILGLLDAAVVLLVKLLLSAFRKIFKGGDDFWGSILGFRPLQFIEDGLDYVDGLLQGEIDKLTNLDFGDAEENISNGFSSIFNVFSENNPEGTKIDISSMFDLGSTTDKLSEFAQGLPGVLVGGVEETSPDESPGAGEQMGTDVGSGLETIMYIFPELGQNIVDGLVGTINSKENIAKAEIAGFKLGNVTAKAVAAGAQVKSPSRETIYVAEMMNKGLVDTLTASFPEAKLTGYKYASSVISGIKDGSSETFNNPSITPVLRADSITKQFSTMEGTMNATRTMSVATTAKLASRDAVVMRNAADEMRAMSMYDDSKVVSNIAALGEDINKLGSSMQGMGFYIDGKKVGRIVTPTVNRSLYTDSIRKGRNN